MLLRHPPPQPMEFAKKTINSAGETVLTKLVAHLADVTDPKAIESIQNTIVALCNDHSMEPGDMIPALVKAAGHRVTVCRNMLEFIKDELGEVVDFNARQGELDQAAVHIAAANGQEKILEALINADADVHVVDKQGDTPLILACRGGHRNSIAVLLKESANPNTKSEIDGTPLQSAVVGGRVDVVRELIENGNTECVDRDPGELDGDELVDKAYWPIGVNEPDKDDSTPLDVVIQAEQSDSPPPENAEICKLLLANGATTKQGSGLQQLIKQVCNSDDLSHHDRMRVAAVVVMLLDASDGEKKLIDPNDKVDGVTPLDLLVWKPIANIMQALLRAGAVLEEGLIQRMLRGMASEDCSQEKFDRLLESIAILTEGTGAPVGDDRLPCTQSPEGEPTLLQLAIKLKLEPVVDVLVNQGADVNDCTPIFLGLKMFSKAYLGGDTNSAVDIRNTIKLLFDAGNLDCNLPADEELNEERTLLEVVTSEEVNDEILRDLVLGEPGVHNPLNAIPNQPSDNPVLAQLMSDLLDNGAEMDPGRAHFILTTVDRLVRCGANVDLMIDDGEKTTTPLKIAIRLSEWELATTIIQVGNADINFLDPFYEEVLLPYCSTGLNPEDYDALKKMLDVFFVNGADATTVNTGEPCSFDVTWQTKHWDLARKLVKKGATINENMSIFKIMGAIADCKTLGDVKQASDLTDLLHFLVENGANVNVVDPNTEKSALGFAIGLEDIGLVEMLLEKADAKEEGMLSSVVNALVNEVVVGQHGSESFMFYEDVALLLINSGADPCTLIDACTSNPDLGGVVSEWAQRIEWSFLDCAILAASEALLNETVEKLGKNIRKSGVLLGKALSKVFEDLSMLSENKEACPEDLHYGPAVTNGFLREVLMTLANKGGLIHLPSGIASTPFETALKMNDNELCRFLIERDADLSTHAPLHQLFTEYYGSEDYHDYAAPASARNKFIFGMAQVIMETNIAFCDVIGQPSGTTSLEMAIVAGDLQTTNFMLDKGVNVNQNNPLCLVLEMIVKGIKHLRCNPKQFRSLVPQMMEKGADIKPESKGFFKDKQQPLQYAIMLRNVSMIRDVIQKGADTNYAPPFPISIQHYCDAENMPEEDAEEEEAFQGELITLLLERNADVEQVGPRGMTSFQAASEFRNI